MHVDPVTLSVVSGWLQEIVDEMDQVVCFSAFSPTISEGYDRANGIYRITGDMVCQGKTGLPLFIEIMHDAVKVVIQEIESEGGFEPGDIIMMNDPYVGGSHLMDVKFFKPFFRNGKLLFFLANTGHWPDIGGASPGGFVAGATEIYQEGLRLPPCKLYSRGELNREFLKLLLANVRTPEERLGDLMAQEGALNVGEKRLHELLDKYGEQTVMSCIGELEKRAEALMREYIKRIPDGVYSSTDYLDNDGFTDEPIEISLDMKIEGSNIIFDFSRHAPIAKGPMNAGISVTASGCSTVIKHLFPDLPLNAGILKPVKIIVPDHSCLRASFPSPVAGAAAEISQRVTDVVSDAFAQAVPQQMWAGMFGTINNVGIGGSEPGLGQYIMYVFSGGGYGAHAGGDGFTYGAPSVGISKVQPYEVFEQLYPVRTRRFSIREDSGGAGMYRGGFGAIIEIEFLGREAKFCLLGDRGSFAPKGMLGGREGAKNEVCVLRKNGDHFTFPLRTKGETVIHRGDVIQLKTPGGGGYGDPSERERELILRDIVNGFTDQQTAQNEYGITIEAEEIKRVRQSL